MTRLGWDLDAKCFLQMLGGRHSSQAYHLHTSNRGAINERICPLSKTSTCQKQADLYKSFTCFKSNPAIYIYIYITELRYIVIHPNPSKPEPHLPALSIKSSFRGPSRQHSALSNIGFFDIPPRRRPIRLLTSPSTIKPAIQVVDIYLVPITHMLHINLSHATSSRVRTGWTCRIILLWTERRPCCLLSVMLATWAFVQERLDG
jgi:hypothetical protein